MYVHRYILQPSLNKARHKAEAGLSDHAGIEGWLRHSRLAVFSRVSVFSARGN